MIAARPDGQRIAINDDVYASREQIVWAHYQRNSDGATQSEDPRSLNRNSWGILHPLEENFGTTRFDDQIVAGMDRTLIRRLGDNLTTRSDKLLRDLNRL